MLRLIAVGIVELVATVEEDSRTATPKGAGNLGAGNASADV